MDSNIDKEKVFPILRKLLIAINHERGFTAADIEQAKLLASKIYVMHTNREVSLEIDEFKLIIDLLQFDHILDK